MNELIRAHANTANQLEAIQETINQSNVLSAEKVAIEAEKVAQLEAMGESVNALTVVVSKLALGLEEARAQNTDRLNIDIAYKELEAQKMDTLTELIGQLQLTSDTSVNVDFDPVTQQLGGIKENLNNVSITAQKQGEKLDFELNGSDAVVTRDGTKIKPLHEKARKDYEVRQHAGDENRVNYTPLLDKAEELLDAELEDQAVVFIEQMLDDLSDVDHEKIDAVSKGVINEVK
jgi:hypothetical protein